MYLGPSRGFTVHKRILFESDDQMSQVRERPLQPQRRRLEFLPVFLFSPDIFSDFLTIACLLDGFRLWTMTLLFRYLSGKISDLPGNQQALVQVSSVPFNNVISTQTPWSSVSPFKMKESQWWHLVVFSFIALFLAFCKGFSWVLHILLRMSL